MRVKGLLSILLLSLIFFSCVEQKKNAVSLPSSQVATVSPTAESSFLNEKKDITLLLIEPSSSPGTDSTPTIRVYSEDLKAGFTATVYTDSRCTSKAGSNSATTNQSVDVTLDTLPTTTSYTFYAKLTDTNNFQSSCSSSSLTYVYTGSTLEAPTSIALDSPGSTPGTSTTPIFLVTGGSVSAGSTVTLYRDSSCLSSWASATATTSGASVTIPALSGEGTYLFYAKVTDVLGRDSACSTVYGSYEYDSNAPTLTIANPPPTTYANNSTTSSFTLSGTCSENGRTISLNLTTLGNITSATCSSGSWSTSLDISAISDGTSSITLSATHSDAAGNTTLASTTFSKDTSAPTIAISSPTAGSYLTSANYRSLTISGTCSDNGQAITITGTGSVSKTTVCSAGAFSVSNVDFSNASNGAIIITADTSDTAGNAATQATVSLIKDNDPLSISSIEPRAGLSSGGTTVTLTGKNFDTDIAITVGGTACTTTTYVSSTSATCVVPANPAGGTAISTQSVVATNAASGNTFTDTLGFTYLGSTAEILMWLDASDSTTINAGSPTTGDAVSAWTDKTGNGNNAGQASGTARPLYRTNLKGSRSGLNFASNDYFLINSGTNIRASTGGVHVFVVSQRRTADDDGFDRLYSSFQAGDTDDNSDESFRVTPYTTSNTGVYAPKINTYSASAGKFIELTYIGQNAQTPGTAATAFIGDIFEVLLFNSELNSTQVASITTYLNAKWGISSSNGSTSDDSLTGSSNTDVLIGGMGSDTLIGSAGDDHIYPDGETFTSTTYADLLLWYDANDIAGDGSVTATGTSITTWTNKAGSSQNVANATTPPTLVKTASSSDLPYISFDGTDDYLRDVGASYDATNANIFIAYTPVDVTTNYTGVLSLYFNGANDYQSVNAVTIYHHATDGQFGVAHNFADIALYNTFSTAGTKQIITVSWNNTDNNAYSSVNGTTPASDPYAGPTISPDSVVIGRREATTEQNQSNYYEIVTFNRSLSSWEETLVNQYLSHKYQITLDGLSLGSDILSGGTGADTFYFPQASYSSSSTPDTILDFSGHDGEGDKLDVSDFPGTFTFRSNGGGTADMTGSVRQIAYEYSSSQGATLVYIDTDGDDYPEMTIKLVGYTKALTENDFNL